MDELCTQHLLRLAQRGEAQALDALFDRARPKLGRLLRVRAPRALLRRTEPEDLVQEALLEGHQQLARFCYRGPGSFFRWLTRIAMHRAQNLNRLAFADKRSPARENRLAEAPVGADPDSAAGILASALAASDPGPNTLLVRAEQTSILRAAVARLSVADQRVITLVRIEGRTLQDAAEALGRTRNATALLLSRALRKLGREMGPAVL